MLNKQTLGLRLMKRDLINIHTVKDLYEKELLLNKLAFKKPDSIYDFALQMISCFYNQEEIFHQRNYHNNRIIFIDCRNYSTFDFNIDADGKDHLISAGKDAANKYMKHVESEKEKNRKQQTEVISLNKQMLELLVHHSHTFSVSFNPTNNHLQVSDLVIHSEDPSTIYSMIKSTGNEYFDEFVLCKLCKNVAAKDGEHRTVLHLAISEQDQQVVQKVLKLTKFMNWSDCQVNKTGQSFLDLALDIKPLNGQYEHASKSVTQAMQAVNLNDNEKRISTEKCKAVRNGIVLELVKHGLFECKEPQEVCEIITSILKNTFDHDLESALQKFCKHHKIKYEMANLSM
jgi:cellobiose-specific phosphotransferase system component IIA